MTRDEIIALAREAGFDYSSLGWTWTAHQFGETLERFAALIAASEREACAEVAAQGFNRALNGDEIADAIRARSTQ